MSKPGPSKGHGGRPRKKGGSKLSKGSMAGYIKVTIGPAGKGTQVYQHRAVAGAGPGSVTGGTVVHHKNHNPSDNSRSNLETMGRRKHGRAGRRG